MLEPDTDTCERRAMTASTARNRLVFGMLASGVAIAELAGMLAYADGSTLLQAVMYGGGTFCTAVLVSTGLAAACGQLGSPSSDDQSPPPP